MRKLSQMFKSYLIRFMIRVFIFLAMLTIYIMDKPLLDFTSVWANRHVVAPTYIFGAVILIEMFIQINPKSKISIGCLKQFKRYYKEADEEYATKELNNEINEKNLGAIKVLIVWGIANLVIGILYLKKIIGVEEMVLLSAAYYLGDLICILFFCPFQKILMKNRCCATCRIFAWAHPMMTTPFIFIKHLYSWSLFLIALCIAIRWEYVYHKYPERFFEKTNDNLKCINCTEKMCKIRN